MTRQPQECKTPSPAIYKFESSARAQAALLTNQIQGLFQYNGGGARALSRPNQENVHQTPFPSQRVGSGNETNAQHALVHRLLPAFQCCTQKNWEEPGDEVANIMHSTYCHVCLFSTSYEYIKSIITS